MKKKELLIFLLFILFVNADYVANASLFFIDPSININSSVSSMHTCFGNASAVKSISFTASNITSIVSIYSTKNIETSFNQNNFDSLRINVNPVENKIENTVFYFRIKQKFYFLI